MKKIDKTTEIASILNKNFGIDDYQREYRWGKKQIQQLIDDLSNSFLSFYEKEEFDHKSSKEVENYGYYFLGSIIRTSNENKIVDGQQRLTSITLLLIYIINHLDKSLKDYNNLTSKLTDLIYSAPYGDVETFNINVPDRKDCMEHLLNNDLEFDPLNESSMNLKGRYEDIDEYFNPEITGKALYFFAYWIINKVLLIEIVTETQDEAQTIFITMNDRGLNLNSSEMLKAFILSKINGKEDKSKVNTTWQKIVGDIKKASGTEQSGIVNTADVEFISLWLRGNYALSLRESKKDSTDKDYELLGEKFHEWVRQNHTNSMNLINSDDFKDFVLKEMKQISDFYLRVKNYSTVYNSEYEDVYLNANRDLNYQIMLMISAIDKDDTIDIVNQKIKLIAKFVDLFASNRILNYKKPNFNTNKQFLFKVMVNIRNKNVKDIAIILDKSLRDSFIGWDEIKNLSYRNQFFKRYALHFLSRITSYINVRIGNPSQIDTYLNRNCKNPYDIEHIVPNIYEDYKTWFKDENEFIESRNNIGDLIILQKDKNRSYQDKNYYEKIKLYLGDNIIAKTLSKEGYMNNPGLNSLLNKYNFKYYDVMNTNAINERNELYKNIISDIYNIDYIKDMVGGWSIEEYDSIQVETAKEISENLKENIWVIPCNPQYYDIDNALLNLKEIEWGQHNNYKIGETVFIYVSNTVREIRYKCHIEEIDVLPENRKIDDNKFIKNTNGFERDKCIRIKLDEILPIGAITFEMIKEKGIKTTFLGPVKVKGELLELLKEYI